MRRRVFGYNVHIPLEPALVQHVLLDNAANYVKPDIVKKLLQPDDRPRPALLRRRACGATSAGSSPPISRPARSTP